MAWPMWSWPVTLGGRHNDGEGLFVGVTVALKAAVLLPHLVDAALHLLGLIHLWQFFFHVFCLSYLLNEMVLI